MPRPQRSLVLIRAAVLSVGMSLPASAETNHTLPPEASNPAVRAAAAACGPDIEKFCAAIQPGGGRIVRCLIGNQANISNLCRANIQKALSALGR